MNPTLEDARGARDAAMDAVESGASEEFKDALRAVILALATKGEPFVADAVWFAMGVPNGSMPSEDERRVLGPLIRDAMTHYLIKKTGRRLQSRRRHATEMTEWVGMSEIEREMARAEDAAKKVKKKKRRQKQTRCMCLFSADTGNGCGKCGGVL